MTKPISRKRIVELAHESAEEPYKIDDGWLARFMGRLNEESPELAAAVVQAAKKKLKKKSKELNDKTI